MASNAVKQLRRKKLRRITNKIKSFFKGILFLILACILIVVVGISAIVISDAVNTNKEITMLKQAELYNMVEVEDGRELNLSIMGKADAKHTIVTIAGVGVQDFTVFVQHMGQKLPTNTNIALVDRAGYGFSDDSTDEQTVEQIVSDYRVALQKAGLNGPYILLAHEFGGVYATYWSLKYPEEIEGVMFLDGTELIDDNNIESVEYTNEDIFKSFLYKIGFQRLSYNKFFNSSAISLTQQESVCSRSLNANSIMTRAYLSERSLLKENFDAVMSIMEKTEIPKLYVSSKNAFYYEKDVIKYWEYKNQLNEERGLDPFYKFGYETEPVSEDAKTFIAQCQEKYKNETLKFAEQLGNCIVTKMPGDNRIYEQKAEGLVDAIADFIKYLDGNKSAIKAYYEDTRVIDWENYVDTQLGQSTQPAE